MRAAERGTTGRSATSSTLAVRKHKRRDKFCLAKVAVVALRQLARVQRAFR